MTNSDQDSPRFLERFRWAYLFFLLVSAVMLRCSKIFQTDSGMAKPQFGFKGYDAASFKTLTYYCSEKFSSFDGFFIADMFYMLSICWLVYTMYKKIKPREKILGRFRKWIPAYFFGFGIIAIIADVVENFTYLSGNLWLPAIESIKIGAIALFILGFLLYVFVNTDKTVYLRARKFIKSAYISILILLLIGFGLTLMPQGATLIVHLFKSHSFPGLISIMCSVFFINMLAIILSHYPKYIEFRQNKDKSGVDWHMTEQWRGFGIITYMMKKPTDPHIALARHCLGILAYIAWFYIIYKAFALYGLTWYDPLPATAICGGMYLLFASYYYYKFMADKKAFYSNMYRERIDEVDLEPMRKWIRRYIVWLIFTIVFGGIGLFIYWHFGWHVVSYVFSLLFIFCNATCFLLFQFTRSTMTFARGNLDHMLWVNNKDFRPAENRERLKKIFKGKENENWSFIIKGKLWNYLTDFSSNYIFLRRLQAAGFIAVFLLLVSNLFLIFNDVTIFSAIPIFLASLVNVYALFILYVKHMIFYNDYENSNYFLHKKIKEAPGIDMQGIKVSNDNKNKFVLRLAIVPLLVFGILYGIKGIDNFHRMDFTETTTSMRIQEYSNRLETHLETKGINRLAKVASFGGGLKIEFVEFVGAEST